MRNLLQRSVLDQSPKRCNTKNQKRPPHLNKSQTVIVVFWGIKSRTSFKYIFCLVSLTDSLTSVHTDTYFPLSTSQLTSYSVHKYPPTKRNKLGHALKDKLFLNTHWDFEADRIFYSHIPYYSFKSLSQCTG